MGTETDVVRLHSGEGLHEEMDRLALVAWDEAIKDCGLAADPHLATALHEYFADGIRRMSEHHRTPDSVPDGLRIERWTAEARNRENPNT